MPELLLTDYRKFKIADYEGLYSFLMNIGKHPAKEIQENKNVEQNKKFLKSRFDAFTFIVNGPDIDFFDEFITIINEKKDEKFISSSHYTIIIKSNYTLDRWIDKIGIEKLLERDFERENFINRYFTKLMYNPNTGEPFVAIYESMGYVTPFPIKYILPHELYYNDTHRFAVKGDTPVLSYFEYGVSANKFLHSRLDNASDIAKFITESTMKYIQFDYVYDNFRIESYKDAVGIAKIIVEDAYAAMKKGEKSPNLFDIREGVECGDDELTMAFLGYNSDTIARYEESNKCHNVSYDEYPTDADV